MKPAIFKKPHTHEKSKPTSLGFFSVIKQQKLTGINLFKTSAFHHSQTEKVQQLIEAFFEPWNPAFPHVGGREKTHEKQLACLEQIKQRALMGVPCAIQFYHTIFNRKCHDNFGHQLLANAKEIALHIKDPQLLMIIFHLRVNRIPFLDFKEGFFCLKEAANMDGEYAVKAAYCLANLYAREVLQSNQTDPESSTHLIELSSLAMWVSGLTIHHAMNNERANENLQILEEMGSKHASDLLRLRKQLPYPGEDIIRKINAENTERAKAQLLFYFKLAMDKSMKTGPVDIIDSDRYINEYGVEIKTTYSLNLYELIQLKISTEEKEAIFNGYNEHYQRYYDLFKQSSDKGKIGAMYATVYLEKQKTSPNHAIINEILNKIISLPYPPHPIIAKAASDLLTNGGVENSSQFKYQAARLGSIESLMQLALEAFKENDSSVAMDYFEQISTNTHLHNEKLALLFFNTINSEIREKKLALDTNQKIDCYFKMCTNILMDFSNHKRLSICKSITSILRPLFPNIKNRPDAVKKWLAINENNYFLERKEKHFPLLTRKDIQTTMLALANAVQQRILEKQHANITIFSSIKQTPLSSEDEVQQLIEAFLLPWNVNFDMPPDKNAVREKQLALLAQLKALALLGEPAAIAFYHRLFRIYAKDNIEICKVDVRFGYDFAYTIYTDAAHTSQHMCFSHELLAQMKEIALHNKDPYLLMCLYVLKGHVFSFLDLKDAFFCLQEAAKMEGVDSARAAYCLANYYGSEMMKESSSYLSSLYHYIFSLIQHQKISDEQGMMNMHALKEMGSILANDFLMHVNMELLKDGNITLAHVFSALRSNKPSQLMRADDQKAYLKEQFSVYFQLALNKSLEFGLVNVEAPFRSSDNINVSVNFFGLIDWKMQIEATYDNFPYNNMLYYSMIFYHSAQEGKIGAAMGYIDFIQKMQEGHFSTIDPNPNLAQHLLITLTAMSPHKKHPCLAQAAEKLAGCYKIESEQYQQARQKAYQFGCINTAAYLAIDEFESNPQRALACFEEITVNAHFFDPYYAPERKSYVLEELDADETELDTLEKIECYFKMCMDILMDMTNPNRFACCKFVSAALKRLFPDEENRPENVKEWLLINVKDSVIFRNNVGYFPLLTRADIRETVEALTQAAKQQLDVQRRPSFRY